MDRRIEKRYFRTEKSSDELIRRIVSDLDSYDMEEMFTEWIEECNFSEEQLEKSRLGVVMYGLNRAMPSMFKRMAK